tara:strand:- start:541 stop:723 length:183 start_codon:yes stop_codon:yes gene_type:complete
MSYDYVFIHNPKTGGDTITALLNIEKTHTYIYLRKDEILFLLDILLQELQAMSIVLRISI